MLKDIDLGYRAGVLTTGAPVSMGSSLIVAGATTLTHMAASGCVAGETKPQSHNLLAWMFDPSGLANSQAAAAGTVYLLKMQLAAAANIGTLWWHVATAGAGLTAGQNEVGLYTAAGAKLTSTNVDTAATTTGLKTTTITGQAGAAGAVFWLGLVFNGTTPPALARGVGITGASGLINAGLTAANYRYAINGTGQTVLPASITPASNLQGLAFWGALGT